jgi:putative ABC transport system ATP-binding protein
MSDNSYVLKAERLRKSYRLGKREVPALKGIDLALKQGELAVLLGPSGAGKTTTLNLAGCLDRPNGGALELAGQCVYGDGVSLSEGRLDALRREHVGFVFSDFHLLPTLTATENVRVPLLWQDRRHPQRARELLKRVGLGHRLTHRPAELSGGEMQRVAIARALVNEPALLLADEPTGNLDTRTRDEIMGLLTALSRDGVTILLATHDAELTRFAETVLRIDDGLLVED